MKTRVQRVSVCVCMYAYVCVCEKKQSLRRVRVRRVRVALQVQALQQALDLRRQLVAAAAGLLGHWPKS